MVDQDREFRLCFLLRGLGVLDPLKHLGRGQPGNPLGAAWRLRWSLLPPTQVYLLAFGFARRFALATWSSMQVTYDNPSCRASRWALRNGAGTDDRLHYVIWITLFLAGRSLADSNGRLRSSADTAGRRP